MGKMVVTILPDDWDPHKFLHTPIYAFDFQCMIGDLIDFLEFSEANIELQLRRELQQIKTRDVFPTEYREHLVENAEYRFCVSLPLRVRYAAATSLVTSVEWSIRHLEKHLSVSMPSRPKKINRTIHAMRQLQTVTDVKCEEEIQTLEDLIHIRNCIAHSAGLIKGDKNSEKIFASVGRLNGFSLDNWNFLGKHVCINKGALNPYAEKMKQLVVELHKFGK